jgi:hypothetical protein
VDTVEALSRMSFSRVAGGGENACVGVGAASLRLFDGGVEVDPGMILFLLFLLKTVPIRLKPPSRLFFFSSSCTAKGQYNLLIC